MRAAASFAVLGAQLVATTPIPALDPARAPTQYVHEAWTDRDGLPQSYVQAILQTRDGYLWLGTQEGLVRFDGRRFVLYDERNTPELATSSVLSLFEDRMGRLWIGLDGPYVVTIHGGEFASFASPPNEIAGVPHAFAEDEGGDLWIGTSEQLCRVTGESRACFTSEEGLPGTSVFELLAGPGGRLWIGTDRGLALLHGGEFRRFDLPGGVAELRVTALARAGGEIWIGTDSGLYRLVDGSLVGPVKGVTSPVWELLVDRDGSLWVGTGGSGLIRVYDDRAENLASDDGLSEWINALLEDREGSLWIGTRGGGLHRLYDGSVTPFGPPEGLSGEVTFSVEHDRDGSVWIGTDRGLNRLSPDGGVVSWSEHEGLTSPFVASLAADERLGGIWIGTHGGGLLRLRGDRIEPFRGSFGPGTENVWSLLPEEGRGIWAGTHGGLGWLAGRDDTDLLSAGGASQLVIHSLVRRRSGELWVGASDGLYVVRGGTLKPTLFEGPAVTALYEDGSAMLWIGTYDTGLFRLRGDHLDQLTVHHGLYDNTVYAILEDDEKNLWMSCNRGISRVAKHELEQVLAGERERVTPLVFGLADGMRSSECNGGGGSSAAKGADGRLWFSTMRGVVVVDPQRIGGSDVPPLLAVESIQANGEEVDRSRRLRVGPGIRKLEIRYTALSFLKPERVRIRHRLDGFDGDWVEAGADRTAIYTNLPPGSYRFVLSAQNGDGVWNVEGIDLEIELIPRFYQTGWFSVASVLGLAALVGAAHRVRFRYLVRRNELLEVAVEERTLELREAVRESAILDERNRIAQDLHDSLSQGLAGVVLQLEAALRWARGAPQPVQKSLGVAARTAKGCLEETRRSVRALMPGPLERASLPEALETLAREHSSERVVVTFDLEGEPRPLARAAEQQVFRVAQEALANALRHAAASAVEVKLRYSPDRIELSVEDNGCGIVSGRDPRVDRRPGMGLAGMRRRARDLSGILTVGAGRTGGVRVGLEVPSAAVDRCAEEDS